MTRSQSAGASSYPVGLWQRACRTTIVPGVRRLEVGDHAVDVDTTVDRVVVAVRGHREARATEQRLVVLPGGVRDEHGRVGVAELEQARAETQPACTSQCLDRDDPSVGDDRRLGAEDELLHRGDVRREAVDRQVASGPLRPRERRLRDLHALEERNLAGRVEVDPDAQVHLGRASIGDERLGETEDRVSGSLLDFREQRHHGSFRVVYGSISAPAGPGPRVFGRSDGLLEPRWPWGRVRGLDGRRTWCAGEQRLALRPPRWHPLTSKARLRGCLTANSPARAAAGSGWPGLSVGTS
jgi:hypothetical protein